MRLATFASLLALLAGSASVNAAGMSGHWEQRNQGDQFTLELQVRGDAACGRVMGTSHGAAHIDYSGVVGVRRGDVLELVFGSLQAPDTNARAKATVRLAGRTLHWQLTQEIPGSDYWAEARLRRRPVDKHAAAALDTWCASRWGQIAKDDLQRIDVKVD